MGNILHVLMSHFQVNGKYEDWMEVLRLIYYSGECLHVYHRTK